MKLDLSQIPVIDDHMHPFPPREAKGPMCYAITAYKPEPPHQRNSMTAYMMLNEMRRFFDLKDASDEEVLAERDRRWEAGPRAFIQAMMADANLKMLVCDVDSPIDAYWTGRYQKPEDIQLFKDTVQPEVEVAPIVRIEITCNLILKDEGELTFDAFCKRFSERMMERIKEQDAVAVKSVIGYFTGLEVTNPTPDEARAAYDRFLKDRKDLKSEKIWRDYMFYRGAEICAELDLPLQIHTGLGVTPYSDLRVMNPLQLTDFIMEEKFRKLRTILVHAGYPYFREAACLTSHWPQVYVDFSETVPYMGRAAENILPGLMEVAPLTKILFGTDCGGDAEPIWLGAVYGKRAVASVLENCVDNGMLRPKEAQYVAECILYRNVLNLYPKLNNHPLNK